MSKTIRYVECAHCGETIGTYYVTCPYCGVVFSVHDLNIPKIILDCK